MKLGILGCGYSGGRLADRAIRSGCSVRGSTRSPARRDQLAARGVDARLVALDDPASLLDFGFDLDVLVHLAPPPAEDEIEPEVERLRRALPASLRAIVYGSTTGAFGWSSEWIDERTPSGELAPRGRRRVRYEAALRTTGLPVRVARIAGIYGPGRTMKHAMDRGLVLFEGGPPTSRVHVDDLARLLEAMAVKESPDLVIACDDRPAPTLEVANYVAGLLGQPLPPVLSLDEAKSQMSPGAAEMRLSGRRCRSLHRADLIGDLAYPTYREGMRAALVEDGLLSPSP